MGFETIDPVQKEQKTVDPESLLLARNFAQLYHAEHETRIRHVSETEDGKEGNNVLARETERLGRDFSDWLETSDGRVALEKYVRTHDSESIIQFKGMDALIAAYETYHHPESIH